MKKPSINIFQGDGLERFIDILDTILTPGPARNKLKMELRQAVRNYMERAGEIGNPPEIGFTITHSPSEQLLNAANAQDGMLSILSGLAVEVFQSNVQEKTRALRDSCDVGKYPATDKMLEDLNIIYLSIRDIDIKVIKDHMFSVINN